LCRISEGSHGLGCEERPGPTGTLESCERLLYDVEITLNVRGHKRRAVLVVGANARRDGGFMGAGTSESRSGLVPTVILLHGAMGSAASMRELTAFDTIAAREGLNVCYGEGANMGKTALSAVLGHAACAWNTGTHPSVRGEVGDQNDVEYLDSLLNELVWSHAADPCVARHRRACSTARHERRAVLQTMWGCPVVTAHRSFSPCWLCRRRIYMCGLSNGGVLCHEYACRRSAKLAAAAMVSASMVGGGAVNYPPPEQPLPVLLVHGASDEVVPTTGGLSPSALARRGQEVPFLPLSEVVSFWAKANRFPRFAKPEVYEQGTLFSTTFHPADEGSAVEGGEGGCGGGGGGGGPRATRTGGSPEPVGGGVDSAVATEPGAVTEYLLDMAARHGWPGGHSKLMDGGFQFSGTEKVWQFFSDKERALAEGADTYDCLGLPSASQGSGRDSSGTSGVL
jgi:poly(3-hydroxybutyrate) depolymerase